jgi:predicted phosphodiesterase
MKGHIVTLPFTTEPITIYFLSDIHLGARDVDMEAIKDTIELIKNTPNAYWFGLGDYGDFIPMTDKRFDIRLINENEIKNFQDDIAFIGDWYIRLIEKYLSPIKDKCLFLVLGNHETVFMDKTGYNVAKRLSDIFNVEVAEYEAFVRIRFVEGQRTRSHITFYLNHGYGGGKTVGSQINRVEELAKFYEADVYAMGHNHKVGVSKGHVTRLTIGGNIERRVTMFVSVGGFKLGKDSNATTYETRSGMEARDGIAWIKLYLKRMDGKENGRYEIEGSIR